MLFALIAVALSVCQATRAINLYYGIKTFTHVNLIQNNEVIIDFWSGKIHVAPDVFKVTKSEQIDPINGPVNISENTYQIDDRKFVVVSVSFPDGTQVNGSIPNLSSEDQLLSHFSLQHCLHYIFEMQQLEIPREAEPFRLSNMIFRDYIQ